MQLTRRNEFARLLNRRRDTAQVRDTADIIQAVQHLTHTDLRRTTDLCAAKVACSEARLQTHLNDYASSAVGGNAQQQMTLITQAINAVKASNLPPDQKRVKLDELQALRIKIATNIREVFDKTTLQASRP